MQEDWTVLKEAPLALRHTSPELIRGVPLESRAPPAVGQPCDPLMVFRGDRAAPVFMSEVVRRFGMALQVAGEVHWASVALSHETPTPNHVEGTTGL